MLGCLGLLGCSGGRQELRHCAFTVNPHRACSLVPRPRPAFRHLQYGKRGSLVSFLTWGWCNRQMAKNFRIQWTISSTLGVYNSRPPLDGYMWQDLSSSCCSAPQCAHVQLSPFYPWHHAHEKRYQALHVLCVIDGNEANRPANPSAGHRAG